MPASAPKATRPHLSSGLVRKGHLRSARTWGGGVLPPDATLLTLHTCHPCHLLAHLQPLGKKHLQRHKQGISEITDATQTDCSTLWARGRGGLPAPGRAVPSKPPLPRGPGVTALPLETKHQAQAAQNDSGSLTLNPKLSQEGHHEFLKRHLGKSLRLTQLWL